MTFQRQLTELLHHASAAVLPRPEIPTEDLPLALAGHQALVVLLRNLHPLVTGVGAAASPVWSGVEDVEGHPVALLGRLLAEHPAMVPISPIDAQVAKARSRLGVHWQQIGRAATVAMADWDGADTATRPRGDAAWTVVAHVAALSRALPVLDADLSRALADHGDPRSSAALAAAATSGLATVAAAVLDLAGAGPLPELRLNPTPTKPIRVDCPPAVTAGQQRLARLLERGKQLHPSDVDLISKLQWRTARTAASVLSETHPELASALDDYRHALVEVPGALGRVTSLDGRNPAAVAQARQLHGYLIAARDTPDALAAAVGFAAQVPAVISALHAATARMLDTGKWLVIDGHAAPGAPWWTPSRPGTPAPVLDRLATARNITRTWQSPPVSSDPAQSSPSPVDEPARQTLDALEAAVLERLRPTRPATPAQRPDALAERRPAALADPSLSKADIALLERVADRTPIAEIAEQLSTSPSAVYARLTRIYAKLRDDGLPAHPTRHKGRRFARTAAGALSLVTTIADAAEARREVERLSDAAQPGRDHDEQLRQARANLRKAQRRLDTARRRTTADDGRTAAPTPRSSHSERSPTTSTPPASGCVSAPLRSPGPSP